MFKSRLTIGLMVLGVIVGGAIAQVLPLSLPTPAATDEMRAALSTAVSVIVVSVGTALLFGLGLSGFKTQFRRAYYLICSGLVVQALGTLTYPATLLIAGQADRNVIGDLPIAIGAVMMFLGIRQIARSLSIKSPLASLWVMGFYLVAVASAMWLLPHRPSPQSELGFDVEHAVLGMEAFIYPLAAMLLWRVRRQAGVSYSRPFGWFLVALSGNFIAAALFLTNAYLAYPQAISTVVAALFTLNTLTYVIAGYSFSAITYRLLKKQTSSSTIDIITFTASLVSNPHEVDATLDKLRMFTASRKANQVTSVTEEQELSVIYTQLEDYLVTKEPLRAFTRQQIQDLIQGKFGRLPA